MTVKQKAEEYFENLKYHNIIQYDLGAKKEVKQAFIDGYRECQKEHECQKEQEWHYVKNGDLPKKDGFYVIALHTFDGDATDRCAWLDNAWWCGDGEVRHYVNERVYAWKDKPVPPKDIEVNNQVDGDWVVRSKEPL